MTMTRQDKTYMIRQDMQRAKTRQDTERQDKTIHEKRRQGKARQDKSRQGNARQGKARQRNATRKPSEDPTASFVVDRSIFDRYYFPSNCLYFLMTYIFRIPYKYKLTAKDCARRQKSSGKNYHFYCSMYGNTSFSQTSNTIQIKSSSTKRSRG
jgi:hypothetical protein